MSTGPQGLRIPFIWMDTDSMAVILPPLLVAQREEMAYSGTKGL